MDEVGRGCLAGPVTVAGVIFDPYHHPIVGVKDSKAVNQSQREFLAKKIITQATAVRVVHQSVSKINRHGINHAIFQGMYLVYQKLTKPQAVLVDGKYLPTWTQQVHHKQAIIKGDQLCYSIAAASIVAKVARDELMIKLARKFPLYGWDQNKGYATKAHRQAIMTHGVSQHHRKLFVRNILAQIQSSSTEQS